MADSDYLLDLLGEGAIDLGNGHYARITSHHDCLAAGLFHVHPAAGGDHTPVGEPCAGSITFDLPENADRPGPRWQLVSLDPLTVEPSLLCSCKSHGFIRNGKWIEA
jgi:hypothetical protein